MSAPIFWAFFAIGVVVYVGVQLCLGFDASRFDADGRS